MMIVQHVFSVCILDRNLIGYPPRNNGWMMLILNDQFLHLRYRIFSSIYKMLGNIRNLCPHDHSGLITQIIKILIMLVMRQTDTVCSDFTDQRHIFVMVLCCDRISYLFPILMTGYPVKRIGSSI